MSFFIHNGSERVVATPNYEDALLKKYWDHWLELHLKPVPTPVWFQDWLNRIPSIGCHCQTDFQEIVSRLPPDFSNKEAFFEWSVAAHNCVNAKLLKPKLSIDQVRQVYQPGIDGLMAVTSLSNGNLHQHDALNSWLAAGLSIMAVQQRREIDQLKQEYWQVKDFIAADTWQSAYDKPTVPISDMLAVASRLNTKILLINSDIEIEGSQQPLIDARDSTAVSVGHRHNYSTDKSRNTPEEWGLDAFILSPQHASLLDRERYEIGRPMWDYWLPYALKHSGFKLETIQAKLFYHRSHPQRWTQTEWQLGADWFQARFGPVHDWVQFRKTLLGRE